MTVNHPETFRRLAIATALELYARTGIKANRAYTPAAMMRTASSITGLKFKARDYVGAAAAIRSTLTTTED